MPLWGRNDQSVTANSVTTQESSNGAPIGTYALVKGDQVGRTSGANAHFGNTSSMTRASVDVNMFGNSTPSAFIIGQAVGVFGADTTETTFNVAQGIAHAGWQVRRGGTGPVTAFTVTASGAYFANGETITVSNGYSNATGTITSNGTANMVSVVVTGGGSGFTNTSMAAITFNREKHLFGINVSGTGTDYGNTDYIVVSNGTVNAIANVETDGSGDPLTFTITNVGLFPANIANNQLVVNIYAANGASSNGTGTTFTANAAPSTGGTVTLTLGGRANRVHYETLVAMGSLGAQTAPYGTPADVADASDDAILPDS